MVVLYFGVASKGDVLTSNNLKKDKEILQKVFVLHWWRGEKVWTPSVLDKRVEYLKKLFEENDEALGDTPTSLSNTEAVMVGV